MTDRNIDVFDLPLPTPAKGCTNTRDMPKASATKHACCPPAPPKHCKV